MMSQTFIAVTPHLLRYMYLYNDISWKLMREISPTIIIVLQRFKASKLTFDLTCNDLALSVEPTMVILLRNILTR